MPKLFILFPDSYLACSYLRIFSLARVYYELERILQVSIELDFFIWHSRFARMINLNKLAKSRSNRYYMRDSVNSNRSSFKLTDSHAASCSNCKPSCKQSNISS